MIVTESGEERPAVAPLIISASRATDIPAFLGAWFLDRLRDGYVVWTNPFNGKPLLVSFSELRVVVFWSKNPAPFIPFLKVLDKSNIHYYFQFTVNDYEAEGLEKHIPPLDERLRTFIRLSDMIGPSRVLWRFDPLLLTQTLSAEVLAGRIERIGRALAGKTHRCTVSFLSMYARVSRNLARMGVRIRPWEQADRETIAQALLHLGREYGITVVSCADETGLADMGIPIGHCIDRELILREFGHDETLKAFFGDVSAKSLKDRGQRKACGCMASKDIGSYNSCRHGCTYCYACK